MNLDYYKQAIKNCFNDIEMPKSGVYLAGGAITSIFSGQAINDLDLYFDSAKTLAQFIDDNSPFIVSCTDKAATLTINTSRYSYRTIQCIYFDYFDNPQQIFDSFDFSINTGCYVFETEEFVFGEDFFKDLALKRLSFNPKTAFPLVSLLRINKYLSRGYKISTGEMRKLGFTVAKLDLSTKEEFIKHLGGMYSLTALLEIMLWPENEAFDSDKALELVSKAMETDPVLNFDDAPKRQELEMTTSVPYEYLVSCLKDDPDDVKFQEFKQQSYTFEFDKSKASAADKMQDIRLLTFDSKLNILSNMKFNQHDLFSSFNRMEGPLAILHMMLFPQNYDPHLKDLVKMLKSSEGFGKDNDGDNIPY